VRNIGVALIMWRKLVKRPNRRKTFLEQILSSQLTLEIVLHSIASLLAILTMCAVTATETLLSYLGDGMPMCAVARCTHTHTQDGADLELLKLFGVVFVVRLLAMVVEHMLLLRVIEYLQSRRVASTKVNQSTMILPMSPASTFEDDHHNPGPKLERVQTFGKSSDNVLTRTYSFVTGTNLETSVPHWFMYEMRKLLGGDNATTTPLLMVAVFILFMTYASAIRNDF
jgi:hypothetical protein